MKIKSVLNRVGEKERREEERGPFSLVQSTLSPKQPWPPTQPDYTSQHILFIEERRRKRIDKFLLVKSCQQFLLLYHIWTQIISSFNHSCDMQHNLKQQMNHPCICPDRVQNGNRMLVPRFSKEYHQVENFFEG